MLDEKDPLKVNNTIVVPTTSRSSVISSTIDGSELFSFARDQTKTIKLGIAPSRSISTEQNFEAKMLYGSWVESGDEDKQIEELYKSRLIPSTSPEE